MKALIKEHGRLDWSWESEPFEDLVSSIIGQQLSNKAADTIYSRFLKKLKVRKPKPDKILEMEDDSLRECGISYSKIKYIKGLSNAVLNKDLEMEKLSEMTDEEVVKELTKIKGIGEWTAEMFLMFSLKRPDVFSVGDLGLRNAASNLYGVDRDDRDSIEKVSLRWKPHRTSASRYLWRSLDN